MIDYETMNNWVSLCEIKDRELCFTSKFVELTKPIGGDRRRFAAHLITHLEPSYGSVLDYFGPDELEDDLYSGVDGEAMDVGESLVEVWEDKEIPFEGLDAEWYRDVLRAKLATIKLPEKLITKYVKAYKDAKE